MTASPWRLMSPEEYREALSDMFGRDVAELPTEHAGRRLADMVERGQVYAARNMAGLLFTGTFDVIASHVAQGGGWALPLNLH